MAPDTATLSDVVAADDSKILCPIFIPDSSFMLDLEWNNFWAVATHIHMLEQGYVYVMPVNKRSGEGVETELRRIVERGKTGRRDLPMVANARYYKPLSTLNRHRFLAKGFDKFELEELSLSRRKKERFRNYRDRVLETILREGEAYQKQRIVTVESPRLLRGTHGGLSDVDKVLVDFSYLAVEMGIEPIAVGTGDDLLATHLPPTEVEIYEARRPRRPRNVEERLLESRRGLYSLKFLSDVYNQSKEIGAEQMYAIVVESAQTIYGDADFIIGHTKGKLLDYTSANRIISGLDGIHIVPIRISKGNGITRNEPKSTRESLSYPMFLTYDTLHPHSLYFRQQVNPLNKKEVAELRDPPRTNRVRKKRISRIKKVRLGNVEGLCSYQARGNVNGRREHEDQFFEGINPLHERRAAVRARLKERGYEFIQS